jgi:hypothetical protein
MVDTCWFLPVGLSDRSFQEIESGEYALFYILQSISCIVEKVGLCSGSLLEDCTVGEHQPGPWWLTSTALKMQTWQATAFWPNREPHSPNCLTHFAARSSGLPGERRRTFKREEVTHACSTMARSR